MPMSNDLVIRILMEEANRASQRCEGYRDVLKDTIGDIVLLESQHRERRGQIQQDIDAKCSATGEWLAENRRS